ncbi:aminotransferase class IV [Aurantimonas marianensis]|uniref:Probable branched-chain-amino-acid aminotransferase n=1 Tax=Aurantimonas marianensis TaxID=2920428 RepID=A0A9X2KJH0_9HYPH|nr:aminotransferase class IV [Aurantimonas marianensis]MCP3056667.1 aminotransferase class IV [Aurantimonas marianensis]
MTDIWLNGAFAPCDGAIAANDRGLLLADGIFDTALVLGGRVFRMEEHLERLAAAAGHLEIPVARQDLQAAISALAERQVNGSIRLTVTRGPGPRGIALPPDPRPTVLGSSAPLTPSAMFSAIRLDVSPIRRNETSPTARVKSLAYLDAVLANHAARLAGADEALFLNTQDRVACSALANLFVLKDGELSTPPLADGVLDGITRRWVLAHAGAFGLAVRERSLGLADLRGATLFLTNSLRLLSPATLDPSSIGQPDGQLTSLMTGLCEAIAAECGADPRTLGAEVGPQ